MVTVTAIEHEDVRGKKLKYLKITNGITTVLVNVGDKTYEGVKKLEENKEVKSKGLEDLEEAVIENNKKGGRKG